MFRSPWEVLQCIVVGTVGTLLLGLLFQILYRAGLSRSQSHRRRASGVFGLFCWAVFVEGFNWLLFSICKSRWSRCPSATDRHGCVSPGLDRHVRFPHDASGQAGSHSHVEQHLVSQNSDTWSLLGVPGCQCCPWIVGSLPLLAQSLWSLDTSVGAVGVVRLLLTSSLWSVMCLVRVCCFLWFTNVQSARPSAAVDLAALFTSMALRSQLSRNLCDMRISRLVPSLAQLWTRKQFDFSPTCS